MYILTTDNGMSNCFVPGRAVNAAIVTGEMRTKHVRGILSDVPTGCYAHLEP